MIVIPMAGLSSRFFKAGFTQPKYMLPLFEETVFDWAVRTFEKYFDTEEFIFILRDVYDTPTFVKERVQKLGIKSYKIHVLDTETRGQADTVYLALKDLLDQEVYIFNIDSKIHNFTKSSFELDVEGYLEVFQGEGEHWSFVLPGENNTVLKTTEKVRISELCSNGLYYFRSSLKYVEYFKKFEKQNATCELYIAPMFNLYIEDNKKIKYVLNPKDNISFCGIPEEYYAVRASSGGRS